MPEPPALGLMFRQIAGSQNQCSHLASTVKVSDLACQLGVLCCLPHNSLDAPSVLSCEARTGSAFCCDFNTGALIGVSTYTSLST